MARMIKVGFDDTLTGTIESTPANRMIFKGSEDAQETLRSLVGFHLGNLVAALPPDADDPTADEVLDYVVARMRGKRAWAERVDPGLDVPQVNAFCPTGEGGGQDNSCGSGGGGSGPSLPRNAERVAASPEFKSWFGKSKAVDGGGKPLILYHGTTAAVDSFDPAAGVEAGHGAKGWAAGKVIFMTDDPEHADHFASGPDEQGNPGTGQGGNVMPLYAKMENPYIPSDYLKDNITGGISTAMLEGHDGVIFKGVKDDPTGKPRNIYVVFSPNRVKSAMGNRGTFDSKSPDIRNAFCPTGDGGGIDPSCSPDGSGQGIAPTTTPLGKTPRLRGFGEAPSEAFVKEQARLDAEARAAKTPKGAAKSAQPKVADDVPSALKATSSDARRDVERSLRDFRERRGRVTVREARELSDTLAGMTLKDMRSVASSMGVKTPSGRKAEVVRELAERFREKIHADKGLKEVAAGTWMPKAEADRIVAEVRHEGGAAWQVHDMPGDSASAGRVFVGFEGSASQAEKHGFPLSERVRARLAKSSGKGKATKTRARATKNSYSWNAAALGELVRPLPVWLDPLPDGSVSVREATDRGDEVKRVHPGQSFMEWSAPELWQLGRGLVSLVPHSQAAAEAMLDGLSDEDADAVSFALAESDGPAGFGEGSNVGPADGDRVDDETLADDFRRSIKGRIEAHEDDDHGDDTWRPVANAFCPTGPGGGQDNSCSPAGGGSGGEGKTASLSKQVQLPARDWTDDHTDRLVTPRVKDGKPNECYENARREYAARKAAGEDVRYVVGTLYGTSKESMKPVGGVASDAMDYRATPIPHAWVETSSGKIVDPTPFKYGRGDYKDLPSEPAEEHFHKALYVPEYSVGDESLGSRLSTFPSKGGAK